MANRSILFDIVKGVAIIAVILYHAGMLPFGYLGVEIFLVIGGYVITKSILKSFDQGTFSYRSYLNRRLLRLWPLLVLVSSLSLVIGWFVMLPNDLKLHSEAVVGTVLFLNNIVQHITSGNYWSASNELKPLMHTWYIGVMFQFYVIYPLIFTFSYHFAEDKKTALSRILWCVFLFSLILYLSPIFNTSQNFFLLPSRLFEFASGGLLALSEGNIRRWRGSKALLLGSAAVMLLLFFLHDDLESSKVKVILMVGVSCMFILVDQRGEAVSFLQGLKWLINLGTASYSLYLWHQPIFAFYRYVIDSDGSCGKILMVTAFSLLVGVMSYRYIERPLSLCSRKEKGASILYLVCGTLALSSIIFSIHIYRMEGMIRDVPEMGIYLGDPKRTDPIHHNERIHAFDKDFARNGKKNILIIGDSFGRDWGNILLASGVADSMNISYHTDVDDVLKRRIREADVVFMANNGRCIDRYADILLLVTDKPYYRVGVKNFGNYTGNIYNHDRYGKGYFKQYVEPNQFCKEINSEEKLVFGHHYIDMIEVLRDKDGKIPAFTPEHKLISQDGLHITRFGAKRYAQLLDVWQYLK